MVIGFTGHRDKIANEQSLYRLEERYPGATWIHGGAVGFDTQVNDVGKRLGKVKGDTLIVIEPEYRLYHPKQAPLFRNMTIVNRCGLLVACYDGRKTGGTLYTINYARQTGVPIEYVTPVETIPVAVKL